MNGEKEYYDEGTSMPGWDGPYLQKLKGRNPWGGTYFLQARDEIGQTGREVWLEFEDVCYSNKKDLRGCAVKGDSAEKMDSRIDDGNLATGKFVSCEAVTTWAYCSPTDVFWIIMYDYD